LNTYRNTDIDQGKLISLLRKGDRKAVELLYDQHVSCIYGLALMITKNESTAEKIVTETFSFVWKHRETFNENNQDLKLWLISITRTIAHTRISFDDFLKNHPDHDFVSTPNKALELVFFGGGKIEDVARHLSIKENHLKQLLREATHQYRKELEQA
jgi:DNA-directed RNA polymerase specialized sigma24 family protein